VHFQHGLMLVIGDMVQVGVRIALGACVSADDFQRYHSPLEPYSRGNSPVENLKEKACRLILQALLKLDVTTGLFP
jgi:hypothetical protein